MHTIVMKDKIKFLKLKKTSLININEMRELNL